MKYHWICLALLIPSLHLLAADPATLQVESSYTIRIDGTNVHFSGDITPQSSQALLTALSGRVDTLTITSNGGDGDSGMAIGKFVRAHNIQVDVQEYCFSSCANFIFLGAKTKSLRPNSVLGFHGGLLKAPAHHTANQGTSDNDDPTSTLAPQIRALNSRITDFYKSIGVDSRLIAKSYDLTKPKSHKAWLTVETSEGTQTFTEANFENGAKFIAAMKKENKLKGFDVNFNDLSHTTAYFPNLATLRQYGVTGVQHYPYPTTRQQLDHIAHIIDEGQITVIGDFK